MPDTNPADDPVELEVWSELRALYELPPGSRPHRLIRPFDICIREPTSGAVKKITKIVPYGDGGFAVMSPYLPRMVGWAVKYRRDYRQTLTQTQWSESFKYRATDRVKLSLHPDGFTQFSGQNPGRIVSGRDPASGAPKGVGLMANPFRMPVYSGPTFGVQAWGLHDYPDWAAQKNTNLVLFEPHEIYFNESDAHGYVVEGFLFIAPWFLPHTRFNRHEASARRATLPIWRYHIRGSRMWEFTLLPGIGAPFVLVTIRVSKFPFEFESRSGFVLHGPAERGTGPIRWIVSAFYPAPNIDLAADSSMDYVGDGPK